MQPHDRTAASALCRPLMVLGGVAGSHISLHDAEAAFGVASLMALGSVLAAIRPVTLLAEVVQAGILEVLAGQPDIADGHHMRAWGRQPLQSDFVPNGPIIWVGSVR